MYLFATLVGPFVRLISCNRLASLLLWLNLVLECFRHFFVRLAPYPLAYRYSHITTKLILVSSHVQDPMRCNRFGLSRRLHSEGIFNIVECDQSAFPSP